MILLLLLLEQVRRDGKPVLMIYQISYDFFVQLYQGTGADKSLLSPRLAGVDALGWAVLIPTLIGIVGVGITSAAAAAELRALPPPPPLPDPPYEAALQNAQGRLKRLLYVLTIGLVTSTIAVSLFFHLPSKLAEKSGDAPAAPDDRGDRQHEQEPARHRRRARRGQRQARRPAGGRARRHPRQDRCVRERALDLLGRDLHPHPARCGRGALLVLQRDVRLYAENSRDVEALEAAQKRLGGSGLLTGGLDQVKLLGAVIAPLASGPIAGFVQVALSN